MVQGTEGRSRGSLPRQLHGSDQSVSRHGRLAATARDIYTSSPCTRCVYARSTYLYHWNCGFVETLSQGRTEQNRTERCGGCVVDILCVY